MQVILRSDLDGLGKRGDIVDVADGHARNYLFPKGLALKATPGAVDQAAKMRRSRDLRDASDREVGHHDCHHARAEGDHDHRQGRHRRQVVRFGHHRRHRRRDRSPDRDQARPQGRCTSTIAIKSLGEHTATASLHHAVSFPIRVEVTPVG